MWIEVWKLHDLANIPHALLSIRLEIGGEVRRSRNSGCVAVCLAMETGCESQAGADNLYESYNTEKTETNLLSLGKWFFYTWLYDVHGGLPCTLISKLCSLNNAHVIVFFSLLFCHEISKIFECAYFQRKNIFT